MFENYETLFTPRTIDDIVFMDDETKQLVADIVSNARPFPVREGKCGILLHGVVGTGKSALAKLLPDALEEGRGGVSANANYIQVQPGNAGLRLLNTIANQVQFYPCSFSTNHYIVLDEADLLNDEAMRMLKGLMNTPHTVWVLTTNDYSAISAGVRDRCHCIAFNAAPAASWLPLARRILAHANVVGISDDALEAIIKPCRGSAREITDAIIKLAINVHRAQSQSAAVI